MIYKQTQDLVKKVVAFTAHFDRRFKYTMGTKVINEAVELSVLLYQVDLININPKEKEVICKSLIKFQKLMRLCKDILLISVDEFSDTVILTESIKKSFSLKTQ